MFASYNLGVPKGAPLLAGMRQRAMLWRTFRDVWMQKGGTINNKRKEKAKRRSSPPFFFPRELKPNNQLKHGAGGALVHPVCAQRRRCVWFSTGFLEDISKYWERFP